MSLARGLRAASYLAMMAWAVLWSFPWALHSPGKQPTDLSFTPLAHRLFAEGRPWGADTLHTSGIWGFLRFPLFDPGTFSLYVGIHVALGALIGWFFADRSLQLPRHRWVLLLTSAALLPLLSASDDAQWYIPIFGLLVMQTQDRPRSAPPALVWALALAAALAVHAKGNLLIATGVVAVALLASDLYRRRIPWTVILIGAFTIVLLYAGGGDLAGFARYTIHVIESTRAYPEAFSQSDDAWAPALFLLGVVCASMARCLQIEHRWQWPLAIAFAALLFLLYKGAFVRHDAIHATRSLTAALLVVGTETVAALCCWRPSAIPRWRAMTAAGLALASLLLFLTPVSDKQVRYIMARDLRIPSSYAARFVKTSQEELRWRRDRRLELIRRHAPLQGIDGSIATVGTYHTPVLAHGLREEALPVIAHYEVWSPRSVADVNRYLESEEAPRFLLRSANYASASNELTLARLYRPRQAAFYYTILERRTEPLVVSSQTLFDGTVGWDEPIDIPGEHWDSILVAEVHFHKNMAGRLVAFLHHPAHVQMVLEEPDGREASVRITSLLAGQGVLAAAGTVHPAYGAHLQSRGPTSARRKSIQGGHWGGTAAALHLARHPILTEVASNVRRIRFRAQTLRWDATALFKPELQVRIRAVSLNETSRPEGQ